MIGDLILFRPATTGKSANLLAQTMVSGHRAHMSHVAIVIGLNTAIHAMPSGGVHLVDLRKLLKNYNNEFSVLHSAKIDQNPSLKFQLFDNLIFYLEQKYSLLSFLWRREDSSYCSELAAKAYEKTGMPLSDKPPRHVLPVDLEKLFDHPQWIDVSNRYRRTALDDLLESHFPGWNEIYESEPEDMRHRYDLLRGAINRQQRLLKLLNRLRGFFGLPAIQLEQTSKYWDTPTEKEC